MLRFEFLAARHGDSILVQWGTGGVMLVDGGPQTVYEQTLSPRLMQLPHDPGEARYVDVVCVSHVDEDHIVGIQRLLREIRRTERDGKISAVRIGTLWHNSVEDLVDVAEPGLAEAVAPLVEQARKDAVVGASYNQGRDVRDDGVVLHVDGNRPFGGAVLAGKTATVRGLQVTVVNPDQTAVDKLAERWRAAKRRNDPGVITQGFSDDSVPNLSSISLFLRHEQRTALLTADARGDNILRGLEAVGLLQPRGVLKVDLLQLPHHGSERNVDASFFARIHADHYVASTDGLKHHHPSEHTLRWVVHSRADQDEYTIHLNHDVGFARTALEALQRGRKFRVAVRSASERAETVSLLA